MAISTKTVGRVIGGTAVAALLATTATPALARPDSDGISAGEVIAGAVVLGGLAAILTASGDRDATGYRDYRYDRDGGQYDRGRYRDGYRGGRQAVAQCVNAVERGSGFRRSRINVTEIRDIDRTRYGYRVRGTVEAEQYRRGYRDGYDRGRFTCVVERGRLVDVDVSGLKRYRDYRR